LEDDRSPATEAWVLAQNGLTFGMLAGVPERARIRSRLAELWDYERQGLPVRRGGRLFMTRSGRGQAQSVLWWQEGASGELRVLLDPNRLSFDGSVALADFEPSADGKLLAYGLSTAGSDWQTWRVREVDSGQDLEDTVPWVRLSSTAWTRDGRGFFYSRYPVSVTNGSPASLARQAHELRYHSLGGVPGEDPVVFARPDRPEWNYFARVSEDGRYLVVTVTVGTDTRNGVLVVDLERQPWRVEELLMGFDAAHRFVGNEGQRLFFQTDAGAPLGRLVALDLAQTGSQAFRELVAEGEDVLEAVTRAGERFYLRYLHHAVSRVLVTDLAGRPLEWIAMPGLGSIGGISGSAGAEEVFMVYSSLATPPTVYRHRPGKGAPEVWHVPEVAFDSSRFEIRQVFYRSRDGTAVPMFLAHLRGLAMDGKRPTLLHGYGGFGISMIPRFSVPPLVWMEMGGVYAVPGLRGGGEYGERWHQAGAGRHKQNSFDDFIAAAEWLIAHEVTTSRRLAIMGASNGGLLVGACMVQRPGLFAVALPSVGVFDMLRYARFTIGWAWETEYGAVEDRDVFQVLRAYSPYHNIREGTVYPSTLVATADHDDRVVPAHSFKFIAALQAAHVGDNPVLIRVEPQSGHGPGATLNKQLELAADQWAFAVSEMRYELSPEW
jgi:prolyl oligopeptidase